MIRICSYCKEHLGYTEDHKEGDDQITHGVCTKCFDKQIELAKKSVKYPPVRPDRTPSK
jgi:hypothetical protein